MKTVKDSYKQFLEYFGITKKDFYAFGIENTETADVKIAQEQWEEIKNRIFNGGEVYIRGYGRDAAHTRLFVDFYKEIFPNLTIKKDPTNNAISRKNLQKATGFKVNDTIYNYQCSHVFGHTKNPFLFEAVWNICFTPKIFDPLTGHEAKGEWPGEYQELFINMIKEKYEDIINDYNQMIDKFDIENKIELFILANKDKYTDKILEKFKKDLLLEWVKL